jgi:ketoreductase RED2
LPLFPTIDVDADQLVRVDSPIPDPTQQLIPLDAITADDWHRILGVNVVGTWQVSVAAVKVMEPGAQIINITSVGGTRPLGNSIPYSVSERRALRVP